MLKMPVARYFFFVGAALLALLFVADAYLPKLPVTAVADAALDTPLIRIQSDRKWPERIVFDTSIPAVTPVQTAAAVPMRAPAPVQASAGVADVSAKVREAFAQLPPSDSKPSQQLQPSAAPAVVPQKRKIAKKRSQPPMVVVAQQQQQRPFDFFGHNTW